jgi:hypothetical protein
MRNSNRKTRSNLIWSNTLFAVSLSTFVFVLLILSRYSVDAMIPHGGSANVGSDQKISLANEIANNSATNYSNIKNNSVLASLVGKTNVSSLPILGKLPPRAPAHLIPFHPKDLSTFSAAKKRAEQGLTNSSVRVFTLNLVNR